MIKQGIIKKMKSTYLNPIRYELPIGSEFICINELIDKKVRFIFNDTIICILCGSKTKKSFAQGYCYPCFRNSPETSECILRPELCRAHLGESRDMEWSNWHCIAKHFVYMAYTGNLKVGVTRSSQIPTRWIDQGAVKAIKICQIPNRYLAGEIEVYLKQFYSDRTNWRKMLIGDFQEDIDFNLVNNEVKLKLEKKYADFILYKEQWQDINFLPFIFQSSPQSLSFDKIKDFEGIVKSIKGQYIIFKNGNVLNIRKHSGYDIMIEY